MTPKVLVVDDDEGVRYLLTDLLEDAGLQVTQAADGQQALDILAQEDFHLVLTDLRMPGIDGLQLLATIAEKEPAPKVILITAHGSERAAVSAMKKGAYDYFKKPFEIDELMTVVERAVESVRLHADNERLEAELNLSRSMVYASTSMADLALTIWRAGRSAAPVLIVGESGTGKERVAEALVRASERAHNPFVRFNCAAIAPELSDAELFGHERGAFTGADRARKGLFRQADGGTLLLDEVGELDARTQAKLLRVLQEGEVRPLGAETAVSVDVRILAATHRDLHAQVAAGQFRQDLLYRLRVVEIRVPALLERPEDIPALARHFLRRHGIDDPDTNSHPETDPKLTSVRERAEGSAAVDGVGAALTQRLLSYRWPGNVRELENAITSLVALSPPSGLDLSLLPAEGSMQSEGPPLGLEERLRAYERSLVNIALREAGGNKTAAARALGIGRATLYEKLKRFGDPLA